MKYHCSDKGCPFVVRFTRLGDGEWHVTSLSGTDHNPCNGRYKSSSTVLVKKLRTLEQGLLEGKAKMLQEHVALHLHANVKLKDVESENGKGSGEPFMGVASQSVGG